MLSFENCKLVDTNKNELKCQIYRNQLEQKMSIFAQIHKVYIVTPELGFFEQKLVGRVDVEYTEALFKQLINVKITHLLNNVVNDAVFYETDVTSVSNVKTSKFELKIIEPSSSKYDCQFIAGDKKLIMACFPPFNSEGNYSIGKMTEKIIIDEINIKYKFMIQPFSNNETFSYGNKKEHAVNVYPEVLDFTSKDYLYIMYWVINPDKFKNVTLNPDAPNLECNTIDNKSNNISVTCLVHKSHFDGKTSGYYYTYNLNYKNERDISYLVPPIKVILSSSNPDNTDNTDNTDKPISFGTIEKPLLYFFLLYLFLL